MDPTGVSTHTSVGLMPGLAAIGMGSEAVASMDASTRDHGGGTSHVPPRLGPEQSAGESHEHALRVSSDFVGDVAERLGSGLQSRLHQFDSGRRLLIIGAASRRVLPRFSYTKRVEGFAMHELCNIARAVHVSLVDAC